MFGILAIIFARASLFISLFVSLLAFILVHILAEFAGIVMDGKRPVVDTILRLLGRKGKTHNINEQE